MVGINIGDAMHILKVLGAMHERSLLQNLERLIGDIIYDSHFSFIKADGQQQKKFLYYLARFSNAKKQVELDAYIKSFFDPENSASSRDIIIGFSDYIALSKRRKLTAETIKDLKNAIERGTREPWREVLSKLLRWPDTDAPDAVKKILNCQFYEVGVLSSYGYIVGKNGKPPAERLEILRDVLYADISAEEFSDAYLDGWGKPKSVTRLFKIARTIAALCRNAKRSDADYFLAIKDWTADLGYLKATFYDPIAASRKETWPNV